MQQRDICDTEERHVTGAAQEDTSAPNWKISSSDAGDQSPHQLWETNTEPDNSDKWK